MKEKKEKEIIYFVTRVIIVVGRKSLRLVFFSLFLILMAWVMEYTRFHTQQQLT
jgi:hypothetical protein